MAPEENSKSQEFIDALIRDNRFVVRYREQLEKTAADGTVGAYIYLQNAEFIKQGQQISVRNGKIKINYCEARSIIPLTVENGLVTECAFAATNLVKGKDRTTLVIFTINGTGNYEATTVYFDDEGRALAESNATLVLGDVKPFAIMQNAEVNNLDGMEGYGLPKIYNSIPFFEAADLCYNMLYGDLDKGEKIVFINELLACITKAEDGTSQLTPQQKKLFVLLGEKLPSQDSVIKEYNPEARIDEITKAFELVLSLISLQFGYGTKKYTFENGQIQTATEYIGEKQEEMQELNKQRKQAVDYIRDIVKAALWFSNKFSGTTYDLAEEISVEFDDSYIQEENMKQFDTPLVYVDANAGARPEHAVWQGKVYAYNPNGKLADGRKAGEVYGDFFNETDYGSVTGLMGVNCSHHFYPYHEGDAIPEFKEPEPVEIDGKTYTYYEATQEMRKQEREIRAQKREIEATQALGQDTTTLAAQLKGMQANYRSFSAAAGINPRNSALRVEYGTSDLKKTNAIYRAFSENISINSKTDITNEGAELSKREEKSKELFKIIPPEKGDAIKAINIYNDLRSSEIGRETIDFIIKNKIEVEIYQNNSVCENELKGLYGMKTGNSIYINARNCGTKNKVAETIIHERTHYKFGNKKQQYAEVMCDIAALTHRKGALTSDDILCIIFSVGERYPNYKWR